MSERYDIPGLGAAYAADGWRALKACGDGLHRAGENGVRQILATGDGKVELIAFKERTVAFVNSYMGYPAWYPLLPDAAPRPVKAVLMDLDGTTVRSEEFWIWIIQRALQSVLSDSGFTLSESDIPFVSGYSVNEHLQYALNKYAPAASLKDARAHYTRHTALEMDAILQGRGRPGAFTPAPGIKPFLLGLKERGVRIGLVTSGLYRKAWPEIVSAFDTLGLGKPEDFYDCIITAGQALGEGAPGTLGELCAKPHPWLYAEVGRVGLSVPPQERGAVLGIEDSGAGVCAVRLAGYRTVGIAGGNILKSGARGMCHHYCENFSEILGLIDAAAV